MATIELANSPFFRVIAATLAFTFLDQMLYSLLASRHVPEEYHAARMRGFYRREQRTRFNHTLRMLLDLGSAMFFVVAMDWDISWMDPLYRNWDTFVGPELFWPVRIFFELQIARVLFEMLLTPDVSLTTMMTGIVRSMHVIIPLLLMIINHGAGRTVGIVNFTFMAQMDLVQALVDLKASALPQLVKYLVPWSLIQIIWLVVRVCIPAYATYKGYFGWFIGRGAYGTIVVFQFMLWLALLSAGRERIVVTNDINGYDPRAARLARTQTK